jgi:signal peptidase I
MIVILSCPLLLLALSRCSFVIPTGSMEDTILVGDHLVVNFAAYGIPATGKGRFRREPRRGDVIVFLYPVDIKQAHLKRVIGVPGDKIHLVNKQVFLNGRKLNEPYAVHKSDFVDPYRDNFPAEPNTPLFPPAQAMLEHNVANGEVVVPPDSFFAMGDNRDQSLDSRYWGFVPLRNILGSPICIYWSFDASSQELSDPRSTADHLLDVVFHFATKTRWSRTLQPIRSYPLEPE